MKNNYLKSLALFLLSFTMFACSGPQPHLFAFKVSPGEAIGITRGVLRNLGYKIMIFDREAGIIKTTPRKFYSPKDDTEIAYQLIVTLTRPHEMRVKIAPKAAVEYRDEIMESVVIAFGEAGIKAKYIPPPRNRNPKRRFRPWRH